MLQPYLRVRGSLRAGLVLALASGGLASLQASFQFVGRDLVAGFRQPGASSELVVNLGPVSNYLTLAPGARLVVTNLAAAQLRTAFPNLNSVAWSVSTCMRTNSDPVFPLQTLWVTRARSELATPATPWLRQSQFSQGNAAAKIEGIGTSAANYGSTVPSGTNNTTTGLLLPAGDRNAYSTFVGPGGNLSGAFQGNIENTTPADFEGQGAGVRSDLFELRPASGSTLNTPGVHLGYFELRADGTLAFTAAGGSTPPPRPQITAIARQGQTTTVSFETVAGPTYTLRYTDPAGLAAPVGGWPQGASAAGTGGRITLTDTTPAEGRFYTVVVQP